MLKTGGLYPRPFGQNRPIFDPYEFILNRHKQSRKQSQIILERFWSHFGEFRAISRTCQNRPRSKAWAIAQEFWSKFANFRPLPIHPKSAQTVSRHQSQIILERVWRRFRECEAISRTCLNRPCSKPWAIAQAFCSKSANFRPLRIHSRSTQQSRKQSQIILERFWSHFGEFRAISRTCQNRPRSKAWSIAQEFWSKSANFRPLPIHPKSAQTVSRHQSQIILERVWRRFRECEAISRTCLNRPCSKPWAIAQAFCSKSANFRPLRIHSKSTQTVAQAVANHFRTVLEAFQRVWSDFQDLPKSAMFETCGL